MSLHTVAGRPAGRVLCCADFPERNFEGPSPHHIREALRVRVDSREAITKHLVTPRDRLRVDAVIPMSAVPTSRRSCFANTSSGLGCSTSAARTRACAENGGNGRVYP